jgi:hypothetical protein
MSRSPPHGKTYKLKQLRQKVNIGTFELHLQPKPKKSQVASQNFKFQQIVRILQEHSM